MLKERFLEESICYFCGYAIHNYKLFTLFDDRNVKSCFGCYDPVEIGKTTYYCNLRGIDTQWWYED